MVFFCQHFAQNFGCQLFLTDYNMSVHQISRHLDSKRREASLTIMRIAILEMKVLFTNHSYLVDIHAIKDVERFLIDRKSAMPEIKFKHEIKLCTFNDCFAYCSPEKRHCAKVIGRRCVKLRVTSEYRVFLCV